MHLGWANEKGSTLKLNLNTKLDYFKLPNLLKKTISGLFKIAMCHHIIGLHKWTHVKI